MLKVLSIQYVYELVLFFVRLCLKAGAKVIIIFYQASFSKKIYLFLAHFPKMS